MAYGALICLSSADLKNYFGTACPAQRSSSFQGEHLISCNGFNARFINQGQVCLFVLISILRIIKWDLKMLLVSLLTAQT